MTVRSFALRGGLVVTLGLLLSACKPAFDIRLASESERTPSPAFVVTERDTPEQRPRYHTVRVLKMPDKDLVWHLRARPFGKEASQASLLYGVTPEGFEAVVEPTALEPGSEYALVVSGTAHGQLRFRVDAEGVVRTLD